MDSLSVDKNRSKVRSSLLYTNNTNESTNTQISSIDRINVGGNKRTPRYKTPIQTKSKRDKNNTEQKSQMIIIKQVCSGGLLIF